LSQTVPADRRRSPRTALTLPCTLARGRGGAIVARTVDVGPGGMSVSTSRPLAEDELVRFDLELAGARHVDGHARVLRQQGYGVYALRFEPPVEALRAVAALS
jgi:hypothetical protein